MVLRALLLLVAGCSEMPLAPDPPDASGRDLAFAYPDFAVDTPPPDFAAPADFAGPDLFGCLHDGACADTDGGLVKCLSSADCGGLRCCLHIDYNKGGEVSTFCEWKPHACDPGCGFDSCDTASCRDDTDCAQGEQQALTTLPSCNYGAFGLCGRFCDLPVCR